MIGRLTGRIVECTPGSVLLDVGGVGYFLHIPLSTFYPLSQSAGPTTTLHVHTHVRQEALTLFGFATPGERLTFERLIAISGVGPKIALAVLSGIGVDDLEVAVRGADRDKLQRIPAIGKKTAERILLELRDRLDREDRSSARRTGKAAPATPPARDGVAGDAISALCNLGYSREAASSAVETATREAAGEASLETLLRTALRVLVR
jgi:Holliday junction DNA helicase RuvA